MNQESCGSSSRVQRGWARARMARETSMPAALPPTSPVPIIRRRMANRSSSSRKRSASSANRSSRVRSVRSRSWKASCSSRQGRRAVPAGLARLARFLEAPLPGVHLPQASRRPVGHVRQLGALGQRPEGVALPGMRQVHGRRVPPLDLERLDVDGALPAEHVDEELRRVPDRADGLGGVRRAQHREVGHRREPVEVRAGEHEEVAQHQVAVPVGHQVREAVEDVAGARSGRVDGALDGGGEALEADRRRELHHPRACGSPVPGAGAGRTGNRRAASPASRASAANGRTRGA